MEIQGDVKWRRQQRQLEDFEPSDTDPSNTPGESKSPPMATLNGHTQSP